MATVIPIVSSREGVISGGQQSAAGGADRFAHAWQAMRQDSSIQFNLSPAPSPPQLPAWLEAVFRWLGRIFEPVGQFLGWIASFFPGALYAQILLWTVLGLGAAALLWAIYNWVTHGKWTLRLPRRAPPGDAQMEDEWSPDLAGARSWLEEADVLAGEGRYAEAIHHLLFRSIEDIASRRPKLVRPALTSRELAASQGIPGRARELFTAIARLVERSLFGGRRVSEGDWLQAREAYAGFALPSTWRA